MVVGAEKQFAFFDPQTGAYNAIADVEQDLAMTRLNDGRCDRQGRFLCGGMSEDPSAPARSSVYALDPSRSVRTLITGVTCSNSIRRNPIRQTLAGSAH
ncbi:MAG: SMP-30/gluconolactonase/LRE family protein [Verrucomicrobia bacterium]|nr:SMP-30/gluconolactonase/LRE family protein [Verrucomicrobiota bacterium]